MQIHAERIELCSKGPTDYPSPVILKRDEPKERAHSVKFLALLAEKEVTRKQLKEAMKDLKLLKEMFTTVCDKTERIETRRRLAELINTNFGRFGKKTIAYEARRHKDIWDIIAQPHSSWVFNANAGWGGPSDLLPE